MPEEVKNTDKVPSDSKIRSERIDSVVWGLFFICILYWSAPAYAAFGKILSAHPEVGTLAKDAIVVSPHKFPGGPGASGVLILRKSAVTRSRPSWPGGGTFG